MEAQKSVSILASKLKKVEEKLILSEAVNQESKKFSGYFRVKTENLVKCFGPRLRLWTWTLDFVLGPRFSIT